MKHKQQTLQLFSLVITLALILPNLVQHGMFMDGTQYACVARNMALDRGTFWFPYLSAAWSKMYVNSFMEHLPLVYSLQSKFFLLFGFTVFTEKIYCLIAAICCGFLIFKIWNLLFRENLILGHYWWLATLLWFITPSVFWSFQNNMLENTVSVMVLASTYFALKAVNCPFKIWNILLAGFFIFLAVLSKGLPGFFPITVFLCYYSATQKITFKRAALYTLLLIFIPGIIFTAIVYLNSEARTSLWFYYENRLLRRLEDDPTVTNRFTVLFWLFTDLLVNIGITALLLVFVKFKWSLYKVTTPEKKLILFFFLLGMCGVLPLCLTHVQRATYFVPALPFFAICFAILLSRLVHHLIGQMSTKTAKLLRLASVGAFLTILIYCCCIAGEKARDIAMLEDVEKIGEYVGRNKIIETSKDIYFQWDFQFYLLRYYDTQLSPKKNSNLKYVLIKKDAALENIGDYERAPLELNNFCIYKKRIVQ